MGFLGAVQHYLAAFAVISTLTTADITPGVTLEGYGSFSGTTVSQTLTNKTLPTTVNAWLGIEYASQPVGEGRFAPVGPPTEFSGWKNASSYGYVCIQDPDEVPYPQDEACLTMNVFRPQGISLEEKLPVLIWIHGGGFVAGSARSFDGAAFVSNSKEPLMVVTFNYRINSLGFLPSPLFERQGLLNLGLRDQEQLFKFVQQHISAFGGAASRVTIGGRSAGAHSVGMHLFHNYANASGPSPLFAQAILQSGSATARAFPNASYPLYQTQFATYLSLTGCSSSSLTTDDATLLSCLRSVPTSTLRTASTTLYLTNEYAITWPFQPTRGGPLLEHAGSVSGQAGTFFRIPTITTNVRDEAKYYSPGDLATNAAFLSFLHTLIPGLTPADLADLAALYPDPAADPENGPYAHSPNATQYDRVSAALTDHMYACAGQDTALRLAGAGAPVWKLLFAANNSFPAWEGIPHTADVRYTWDEPVGGVKGVQHAGVGPLLHGWFADFVVRGDPNGEGRPWWPRYVDGGVGRPGLQMRVEAWGGSRVEGDGVRRGECEWWRDEGRAGRLEK